METNVYNRPRFVFVPRTKQASITNTLGGIIQKGIQRVSGGAQAQKGVQGAITNPRRLLPAATNPSTAPKAPSTAPKAPSTAPNTPSAQAPQPKTTTAPATTQAQTTYTQPKGYSFDGEDTFTFGGAGAGALLGAGVGGAADYATGGSGVGGALAGAGLGSIGGGFAGNALHRRASDVITQRGLRGNRQTSWGDVLKKDYGKAQQGSQVASADQAAARLGKPASQVTPEEVQRLAELDKSKAALGNTTPFADQAAWQKWQKKEMAQLHPDHLAQQNLSPEQLAQANSRYGELSRIQADVNAGRLSPQELGLGDWTVKMGSIYAVTPEKTAELAASLAFFRKHAAMPMPSIPTPQFPSGLAKVTPRSTPSTVLKPGATTKAVNTTQVHTQPPSVNSSPYSGVKSVPPPSVKR